MPFWVAMCASAYGILIAYQAAIAIETGRAAIVAIPFLLLKVLVLLFALSYWDQDACRVIAGKVGGYPVLFAGVFTLQEAAWHVRYAILDPKWKFENDNFVVLVTLLAGVVFPAVIFLFAATVAFFGSCAS